MLYLLFFQCYYNSDSKVAFKETSNQKFLLLEHIFLEFFSNFKCFPLFTSIPSFTEARFKFKKILYMNNLIHQRDVA